MRRGTLLMGLVLALLLTNVTWYLWPRLQPAVQPQPPEPGVESLVLLSELAETPAPALSIHDLTPIRLAPRCWWLGPLPTSDVDMMAFDSLPAGTKVLGRPTVDGTEHWVVIAPGDSAVPLDALLARAQEMGLDSYLMEDGELAGQLSFGYFREAVTAGSVFRARQAQGFPVRLLSRPRVRDRDWLLLTPALRESMNWALLSAPPAPWGNLRLDPTPCALDAVAGAPRPD